ncbi:MAG: hypothetical protein OCD76_09360 [Reichenbachiella sp.]
MKFLILLLLTTSLYCQHNQKADLQPAYTALLNQQSQKALELYRTITILHPYILDAWYGSYAACLQLRDNQCALTESEKGLGYFPTDILLTIKKLYALAALKQIDTATSLMDQFEKGAFGELDEEYRYFVYHAIAFGFLAAQEFSLSERYFIRGLDYFPNSEELKNGLAIVSQLTPNTFSFETNFNSGLINYSPNHISNQGYYSSGELTTTISQNHAIRLFYGKTSINHKQQYSGTNYYGITSYLEESSTLPIIDDSRQIDTTVINGTTWYTPYAVTQIDASDSEKYSNVDTVHWNDSTETIPSNQHDFIFGYSIQNAFSNVDSWSAGYRFTQSNISNTKQMHTFFGEVDLSFKYIQPKMSFYYSYNNASLALTQISPSITLPFKNFKSTTTLNIVQYQAGASNNISFDPTQYSIDLEASLTLSRFLITAGYSTGDQYLAIKSDQKSIQNSTNTIQWKATGSIEFALPWYGITPYYYGSHTQYPDSWSQLHMGGVYIPW